MDEKKQGKEFYMDRQDKQRNEERNLSSSQP
jgi:hypothetical protein